MPVSQDRFHHQRGQIGVIILLIMVVLLTIGLSLASRSTQQLFLSQQQAESTRVFNAAEAGVEQAISSSLVFEGNSVSGDIQDFSSTDIDVNYEVKKVNFLETRLFELVAVKMDVTGALDGYGLQVDWSQESDCTTQTPASLIAAIYYEAAGETRVRYEALGSCDRGDGFTLASTIDVNNYHRRATINLATGDLFVRIKPVYNDTHIRVTGVGWTLPTQFYNIRSEATNPVGNEVRIVEVNRTLSAAPAIMDYVLYSGTTLVK